MIIIFRNTRSSCSSSIITLWNTKTNNPKNYYGVYAKNVKSKNKIEMGFKKSL